MGTDFFNAEAFPTANFTADILRSAEGYAAQGILTIKDQSLPVTLPFTLDLVDGVAQMQGSATLDRRNFNVGNGQTDEGSLGFSVDVNVMVTAAKAD